MRWAELKSKNNGWCGKHTEFYNECRMYRNCLPVPSFSSCSVCGGRMKILWGRSLRDLFGTQRRNKSLHFVWGLRNPLWIVSLTNALSNLNSPNSTNNTQKNIPLPLLDKRIVKTQYSRWNLYIMKGRKNLISANWFLQLFVIFCVWPDVSAAFLLLVC